MFVGFISTFILLSLPPALGGMEGGEGRGEESSKRGQEERGGDEGRGEVRLRGAEELEGGEEGRGEERCVRKVVMESRGVRDTVLQCQHSYSQRCHTTYITGNVDSIHYSQLQRGQFI